ncbi:hypothetical protein THASP1DRAFT_13529, partial [Thamnocephalis sphaerospora]
GLQCDVSLANSLARRNTLLFKEYADSDPRVRPVLFAIKQWAKARKIGEASNQGGSTINSYTHVLMALAFLQRRGVIPVLQRICCTQGSSSHGTVFTDGQETYFFTGTLPRSSNCETVGELLVEFFRYYAFHFDATQQCVSVRLGGTVLRSAKGWQDNMTSRMLTRDRKPAGLCVEDPFILDRNCAMSAIRHVWRGLRWEYERAFRALVGGHGLNGATENWTRWPSSVYDVLGIY